jgi:hypothetical protein
MQILYMCRRVFLTCAACNDIIARSKLHPKLAVDTILLIAADFKSNKNAPGGKNEVSNDMFRTLHKIFQGLTNLPPWNNIIIGYRTFII